ncbi:MAG TPA: peptidylprolyl isomerase [Mycobacteriales bacterium]|nr:peptidylprolyl isomerase [Mycobacteriales bacterium]
MSAPVGVAAWVDGEPVPAAEVAAELDRLRSGPLRLPPDGTQDGRQLRRWVTQRVVIRRLLATAARTLPPGPDDLRADPALVGTAAADVVATSAAARAVLASVADPPGEAEVRAHYDAHPDRYSRPERWLVRQAFGPDPAELPLSPPYEVDPATLVPPLRTAPAGPVESALGWHRLVVEEVRPAGPVPYDEAGPAIAAELTARRTQLAFARWLDAALATRVRLAPGYEHPADPRNPDATHRH